MREHIKSYIQLCLRTNKCEPNNTEVKAYLDLRGRTYAVKYNWVEVKVICTPYIMNIEVAIKTVGIVVSDP